MRTWVGSPPGWTFDPGGFIGGAISARASPGNDNKTAANKKINKNRILHFIDYSPQCIGN
jgi:hypothetical protein